MKAVIKTVSHGKQKGQFRFMLKSANGEVIAVSETYTQKHNVLDVLANYFPNFEVIDKTKL